MEYTPQELSGVLFYYNTNRDAQFKSEWERTRIQTYFLLNIQLTKKDKLTYDRFKKDWSFFWESKKDLIPEDTMSENQWFEIINKPTISKTISPINDLE